MNIYENLKKQMIDTMDGILTECEGEKRDMTDAERNEFRMTEDALAQLEKDGNKAVRSPKLQRENTVAGVKQWGEIGPSYRKMFYGSDNAPISRVETAEDFLRRAATTRTMLSGSVETGGGTVPDYWLADIMRDAYQISVALPRVRQFPMQGPSLHIPAMNSENQDDGFMGGVSGSWLSEGEANTEVSPRLRHIILWVSKLMMNLSASRELIEDSTSLAAIIGPQMIYGLQQMVDEAVLTGDGIGKPLGILNAPATISVKRNTTNQIKFADVASMYSRLHPVYFRNACWVANPSTMPYLLTLADGASQYIWQPSMGMVEGAVNMPLFGLPVLFSDKLPALGTKGDLMLINFSSYALGIRQGAQLESTNAARWLEDLVSYRACLRVGGHPLLDTAITPRTGGDTLSAYVALN